MLRAIGTTRRQMRRIVRYESVITSIIGGILGTVLGVLFAYIVSTRLASQGITFSVPWSQLVVFLDRGRLRGRGRRRAAGAPGGAGQRARSHPLRVEARGIATVTHERPDDKRGAVNPVADPFDAEIEARAAELRALIAATPMPRPRTAGRRAGSSCASVAASATCSSRRRLLIAAGALTFVLLMTGVSLLGVAIFAPGVLLSPWRSAGGRSTALYLPGLGPRGLGHRHDRRQGDRLAHVPERRGPGLRPGARLADPPRAGRLGAPLAAGLRAASSPASACWPASITRGRSSGTPGRCCSSRSASPFVAARRAAPRRRAGSPSARALTVGGPSRRAREAAAAPGRRTAPGASAPTSRSAWSCSGAQFGTSGLQAARLRRRNQRWFFLRFGDASR